MMLILRTGGRLNSEYDSGLARNELLKFNSQFEIYSTGNDPTDPNFKPITIFDVVTVANLAYSVNKEANWNANTGVSVTLRIGTNTYSIDATRSISKNKMYKGTTTGEVDIYNEIITNNTDKNFYCVNIHYNENTGKVNLMEFQEI